MDKIQETLIKKGRKDLAAEYLEKLAKVVGTYILDVGKGKDFRFTKHEKALAFLRKNKGKYNRIKMRYVPKGG